MSPTPVSIFCSLDHPWIPVPLRENSHLKPKPGWEQLCWEVMEPKLEAPALVYTLNFSQSKAKGITMYWKTLHSLIFHFHLTSPLTPLPLFNLLPHSHLKDFAPTELSAWRPLPPDNCLTHCLNFESAQKSLPWLFKAGNVPTVPCTFTLLHHSPHTDIPVIYKM